MKKRTTLVGLLLLVLVLSSCDKISDLLAVKVDASFVVDMPVTIAEPLLKSTEAAFSTTEKFNPLDDEDLADYKEKIKGYELTGMTGTIRDLSASVTLANATLEVSTAANSATWTFTNLTLTNGTVVTFDNTTSQWAKINAIMDEQKEITVVFSGNSSQTNVTFTLELTFDTEVSTKII